MQPQSTQINSQMGDDEISLVDVFNILWQRKYWAFSAFIIAILLGFFYVFSAAPIHESRSVVDIGEISGMPLQRGMAFYPANTDKIIVEAMGGAAPRSASTLAAMYDEQYRLIQGKTMDPGDAAYVASIIGSGHSIRVTTRARSGDEANRLALTIAMDIVERQNAPLNAYHEDLQQQIAHLEDQALIVDQWLARLPGEARCPDLQGPPSGALPSFSGVADLLRLSFDLERKRSALQRAASPTMVREASLIAGPRDRARIVEPRIPLVAALSVATGLFGGIVLAFLAEFVARMRAAIRAGKTVNHTPP